MLWVRFSRSSRGHLCFTYPIINNCSNTQPFRLRHKIDFLVKFLFVGYLFEHFQLGRPHPLRPVVNYRLPIHATDDCAGKSL
jgi:hypothetical protein